MKHAISVAAICLAFALPGAANADDATVAAISAQFAEAFNSGDADALGALYTEDAYLMPDAADPVVGREAITAFWREFIDGPAGRVELTVDEVIDAGDNHMIERARFALFSDDDEPMGEGKYVNVYTLVDGEWLMHWDIWNGNAPPAEEAEAAEE